MIDSVIEVVTEVKIEAVVVEATLNPEVVSVVVIVEVSEDNEAEEAISEEVEVDSVADSEIERKM